MASVTGSRNGRPSALEPFFPTFLPRMIRFPLRRLPAHRPQYIRGTLTFHQIRPAPLFPAHGSDAHAQSPHPARAQAPACRGWPLTVSSALPVSSPAPRGLCRRSMYSVRASRAPLVRVPDAGADFQIRWCVLGAAAGGMIAPIVRRIFACPTLGHDTMLHSDGPSPTDMRMEHRWKYRTCPGDSLASARFSFRPVGVVGSAALRARYGMGHVLACAL
ncbi:hypothetical protein EDB83DRAFT_907998 [Lactarius deliciosus]|nr:hypothetical protein EDB83DRAFT_907998 [Lactarius deliciosus]